ncbi:homeodomain-like protein [Vibrio phage vB_VhaP_PG11]|nr:homeodomain-like protein [Vibrio phage vB_VhaP_PG11]
MASREETLARKKQAFFLYKQGTKAPEIAKQLGISERMAYRYIDEYELVQLRQWRTQFKEALEKADKNAPLSHFLNILRKG